MSPSESVMYRLPNWFAMYELWGLWYIFKSGLAAVFPIFNSLLSGMKIPSLAVTKPTESMFVTSSYINVPPTLTSPEKVPVVAVNAPVLTALAKVVTPATLTLSKFVWPSTSKSFTILTTPPIVLIPETLPPPPPPGRFVNWEPSP